ncbi:hypothetical protein RB195_026009 [Necator americanus]|uniref:Uncharacterized protein n=1 Tax=Necator americanus TaxID=51031 RepID=A0ABR1EUX8_NECAM
MMPKFGPSLMTGLSVFALTTFMFVSLRPKITILPTAPPPKSAQALPPAPKIKFVEKRLALKPNLTSPPAISKPSQRMIEFYKIQQQQAPHTLKLLESIRTKAMKATISAETDVSKQRYAIEDLMVMEGVRSIEILKIDIEDHDRDTRHSGGDGYFVDQNISSRILVIFVRDQRSMA